MRDSRFRRQRFNANGLAERIAILLVVAVVAGISIGLLMPKVNPTVGEMTGEYVATGSAAETLQSLTIDDQPSRPGTTAIHSVSGRPMTMATVAMCARTCWRAI